MLTQLLVAALAAAPATELRYAAPGFDAVNVDEKLVAFLADHLAQRLQEGGLQVLTASDMGAVLGLERQKELLGCSDASTSCVTELANALGADGLIVGSVARLDDLYQLNVKVISATDARAIATWSGRADSQREALLALDDAARHLLSRLGGRPEAVAVTPGGSGEPSAGRRWPILPTIGAGLLFAGGVGVTVKSVDERNKAADEFDLEGFRARERDARVQRVAGVSLLVAGAAAAAATTYWYLRADRAEPSVSVTPMAGPGAGGVLLQGRFD